MRVFVAGATGVLGRRLVRQFRARGHEVVGLARSDENVRTIEAMDAVAQRGDLFDAASLARAAQGCEVVVHAATAIPTKVRTRRADWSTNDRIRTEGTTALTKAAAEVGAGVYLQQSVVWLARSPDGGPFDEDSPPRPDATLISALEGERIAQAAGERSGFAAMVLRLGAFYAADAAHTRAMGEGLARGRLPIIGKGDAVWSLLHADDAAEAFVVAAEAPRKGLWHVVDERPVPISEVLRFLANRLGAATPRSVPAWIARLVAGRIVVETFRASFPTSSARFRRDFRWAPVYPTYAEGLDDVVSAWRAEGFPPARTP